MTENDPGVLYTAGLEKIAEKYGVTLKEAYRIAMDDLVATRSYEHITPLQQAFQSLTREKPPKLPALIPTAPIPKSTK